MTEHVFNLPIDFSLKEKQNAVAHELIRVCGAALPTMNE